MCRAFGPPNGKAWAALNFDEAEFLGEAGLMQSGRGAVHAAGAPLGEADMRSARHLGWLYGTRRQNRDREPRLGETELPHRAPPEPGQDDEGPAAVLDARTPPDCKWRVRNSAAPKVPCSRRRPLHAGGSGRP